MKKLIIIAAVSLSGCSTLMDSLLMKYDNGEYRIINEIRTISQLAKADCADAQKIKTATTLLEFKGLELSNYSQHLPHNEQIKVASTELNKMIKGLTDRYKSPEPVSPTFCKLKFENIEKNAETIQRVVGDKPR